MSVNDMDHGCILIIFSHACIRMVTACMWMHVDVSEGYVRRVRFDHICSSGGLAERRGAAYISLIPHTGRAALESVHCGIAVHGDCPDQTALFTQRSIESRPVRLPVFLSQSIPEVHSLWSARRDSVDPRSDKRAPIRIQNAGKGGKACPRRVRSRQRRWCTINFSV